MKEQTREEPRILAAAERQMRAWSLAQEIADDTIGSRRIDPSHARLGNYISISREAGAGGSEIAENVGRQLGWEVLDKNILDEVAQRYRLPRPMLELVDETRSNWAYDILGPLLDHGIVTHEKYLMHLARVTIAAARRGNVVLVGRGGQFLLPRDRGLAVRIIASEKYRIGRIMAKYELSEAKARQMIAVLDGGRKQFVAKFFHHDVADPHLYDLVINVDFLGPQAAAEQIVVAWERTHARQGAPAGPASC